MAWVWVYLIAQGSDFDIYNFKFLKNVICVAGHSYFLNTRCVRSRLATFENVDSKWPLVPNSDARFGDVMFSLSL